MIAIALAFIAPLVIFVAVTARMGPEPRDPWRLRTEMAERRRQFEAAHPGVLGPSVPEVYPEAPRSRATRAVPGGRRAAILGRPALPARA